ncbi:MAG: glycosyltransferase family 2 protein [Acidimicrobiales bacterium]
MSGALALGLLNAAAFMLCVSFVAYATMIILPYVRHRAQPPGNGRDFDWHFLIPCLDEQGVIAATVERLVRTFPQAHVWCVDDASTDATPRILAGLARRHEKVHVVTRRLPHARVGKGPALNAGWEALMAQLPPGADPAGQVVGVLDADSILDPRALDTIAGAAFFGNPHVGAVQIQVRVTTRSGPSGRRVPLLVRLQDLEFSCPIAAMQLLRRRSGSVGMGGNGQFSRLSVLNHIAATHATPWHGALLEDFELGLHVLLSGDRTEYCHDTWVEQEGLPSLRPLIRQRSRWAQGSMQCSRYFAPVMRSRSISTAGALEIAYFLCIPWAQMIGGLVYSASLAVMVFYAVFDSGGLANWLSAATLGVIPLFILFGMAPFMVWGPIYRARVERRVTRRGALALGLSNWIYSYFQYAAVWWAFARILRARNDWKKTLRSSSGPVYAPYTATAVVRGRFTPRRAGSGVGTRIPARLRTRPVDPIDAVFEPAAVTGTGS